VKLQVGRGGGVLSGPASFSRSGFNQFGVLNIAEAAVSPSLMTELKRYLNRQLRGNYCFTFVTPDPFGAGVRRIKINVR
jgi:hypothetical protein